MIDDTIVEPGPDGISGTDGVHVLFPGKPAGVPLPPQPEVVTILEDFLQEAVSGRITGLVIIGFSDVGGHKSALAGKVTFSHSIAALEQMKFGILAREYAANIVAQSQK